MTHEEFEAAQSVIGKQKERGFVQDSGFSLKGKVTCGNCKLKMMYNYGAVPVVYCAHTSAAGKMSTCDKTRHKVKKIERIVLNALRRQLEIFKQLAKKLEEEQKNKQTDLPAIQKEMEKQLELRIHSYELTLRLADAEKIEIRFLFDDLIAEMTEKIEREEKEDVAV